MAKSSEPKIARCTNCEAVMTKRGKKGKGAQVGIVYERPNSDCPVIDESSAVNLMFRLLFSHVHFNGPFLTMPISVGLSPSRTSNMCFFSSRTRAYGNINTTTIGQREKPKVRLPGSGGANDVGSLCRRTIIIMRQDKRKFIEKIDFLTTPGYLTGPGAREKAGLPEGTGPYRVITQLGVYGFDEETKRMKLISVHPGVTVEEIKANTGFDLIIPETVTETQLPSEKELEILRKEIDPAGIVLR